MPTMRINSYSTMEISMLPNEWTPTKGLYYPTEIFLSDGTKKIVNNYKEHHEFIKKLFLNK